MWMGEFDEHKAVEFFKLLEDGPTLREVVEDHPGLENFIQVMSARLIMHAVLPFVESEISAVQLAETIKKYMLTSVAIGIGLHRSDEATQYILDLYNRSH